MTPLEEKEIRGISMKTILWLLGCTVTIVSSVMITSGNITNKLETYIIRQDGVNAIQDLKIRQNEEALNRNSDDLKEIKRDIEIIKSKP